MPALVDVAAKMPLVVATHVRSGRARGMRRVGSRCRMRRSVFVARVGIGVAAKCCSLLAVDRRHHRILESLYDDGEEGREEAGDSGHPSIERRAAGPARLVRGGALRHPVVAPGLRLLPLCPDIPGYERFFGSYLFSGEKKALVDVGPSAAAPSLLSALADVGVNSSEIDYIVLTHIHMDHSGGVGTVVRHLSEARVVAHSRAVPHLADPSRLWQASRKTLGELADQYGRIEPVPEDRVVAATDSMKLDLGGGLELEVHLTPGHAPHHLSLFDRGSGVLLVGEAAGVCVDGALRPSTPPPFRLDETLSSIDRLIALRPEKVCYAHLGCYDNGLELLEQAKRQLVSWHGVVTSDSRAGRSPEEILERMRREDRSLDYMAGLSAAEYEREWKMLVNSVIGLAGPDG